MSILADWFRRAMGKDRATLIGRDNAVCREWQHAYPDAGFGESTWVDPDDVPPLDAAWFAKAELRHGDTVIRPEATPYAQACHARTKGWPQWKINFDLTAHERSLRTAKGNRTRYAAMKKASV